MSVRLDHGEDELTDIHEINVTPFIDVILVLLIIFMIAAPLATVARDTDVLIEPKLSAASPPTKLFPPVPVTEVASPTTPSLMVPILMPTRPPMKLSEVPATWPGRGPETKLANWLLTKLSDTLLPGPDGGLPGPDAGPPNGPKAAEKFSTF